MPEFKVGDWVTVGNAELLTPEKKYEVFKDSYGHLFLLDNWENRRWRPIRQPTQYQTRKTTPPELP